MMPDEPTSVGLNKESKPEEVEIEKKSIKNQIEIASEINLPFSAEIAYDAFSDLSRQPMWSPWLRSVEYISQTETVWEMRRFLGLSYSWTALSTKTERPRLIEWESTKGLKNYGRVEFTQIAKHKSHMKVSLVFVVPKVVSRWMGENGRVARFVRVRMVQKSLRYFRDIVIEEHSSTTAKDGETKRREESLIVQ